MAWIHSGNGFALFPAARSFCRTGSISAPADRCRGRNQKQVFGVRRHLHDHGCKGIYAYRFDAKTGQSTALGVAAESVTRLSSPLMPAAVSSTLSTRLRAMKASLPEP